MNETVVQGMLQELEEQRNILSTRAVRMRGEVAGLQADLKNAHDMLASIREQQQAATKENVEAAL